MPVPASPCRSTYLEDREPHLSAKKGIVTVTIIQDIMNYFKVVMEKLKPTPKPGNGQRPLSPSTKKGGGAGSRTKEDLGPPSISFGKFLLVRMPKPHSDAPDFADDVETEKFANEVGEQIRQAFMEHNVNSYEHVEIYPMASNSVILRRYFSGDLSTFVGACEDKLFGGRGGFEDGAAEEDVTPTADGSRVYLISRNLKFDPAYDVLVRNRMIVRPLERGRIYAPVDYTEMLPGTDQLILGQMEIYKQGERLEKAEICAWVRSDADQASTVIDADFDLLARAESLKNVNSHPLGLSFYCNFRHTNFKREIDEVILDVGGAKKWMESVPSVQYYIDTGGGRNYRKTPVSDYPEETLAIEAERTPQPFKLGEDQVINITRWIDIIASANGRERRYRFGFFDRAIKFSADQNIFRITGQFLPSNQPTEVMLHPAANERPRHIFTLTPHGDGQQGYRLSLLRTTPPMVGTINGQQTLRAGESADVSLGDEIVVTNALGAGRGGELQQYKLQPLNDLQRAYAQQIGKDYAAFISLNSKKDIVLSGKKHVFGRGRSFPHLSANMEINALVFEREWVAVKMKSGDGQPVYYRNVARTTSRGTDPLSRLDDQGINLDLNGSYLVYLGDYEVTLILNATPSATELMSK